MTPNATLCGLSAIFRCDAFKAANDENCSESILRERRCYTLRHCHLLLKFTTYHGVFKKLFKSISGRLQTGDFISRASLAFDRFVQTF